MKNSPDVSHKEAFNTGSTSPYIVGLGASAGGLEALQQFFSSMADDSGMTFVVVQHLSPDYKSMMVELLSKTTSMPVLKVENGMEIKPNHVYIIPPKTQMTIYKGKLFLEESDYSKGLLLPIDTFLKSLADDQGEKSIGIILSGTGSDGTRGITAIKGAGGMAMVQQENTAKFSGMPGSAIATGMADYIQPPDKMPEILLNYIKHPYLTNTATDVHPLLNEDTYLNQLLSTLRDQSGVDFSQYKPSTILRRIERRMGIAQVVSLEEYLRYVKHSEYEVKALYKDLLISVTRFFRDLESYNELKEKVIPEMVNRAEPGKTLRIWVAGCA
ncbi:MAG: chemotaxis protein CheB, partial [Bacillota bacterium]